MYMSKAVFSLEPLTCPSCIKKIEKALLVTPGVEEAKVLFHSGKVRVAFQEQQVSPDELSDLLHRLGYPVLTMKLS